METELPTIQQIKDACLQHLAEVEAATPRPWKFQEGRRLLICRDDTHSEPVLWGDEFEISDFDATFIAHARTMSPASCKCLLLAIDGLERISPLVDGGIFADEALKSIRQEWHNHTKHPTP